MFHYSKNNSGLPADPVAGFTLIELLVSISIVAIILAVILSNQNTYTDKAALTGLADEISLAIAQAQIYSIGVRESSVDPGEFSSSYGIVFDISSSDSSYIYFADLAGGNNNFYNGTWSCPTGPGYECISKINITRGNRISSLCTISLTDVEDCGDVERIDIGFVRPNTEAQIYFNGVALNLLTTKGAKINLVSPLGYTRSVSVFSTGQISVQ